jgi:solute carrier family 25 (mitochondrial carnitine/acylcarnitine transporter), member 20/29
MFSVEGFSGLAGGICQVIVGHPFDTVKVRMQTGSYTGMTDCIRDTLGKERITGFYRGISSPLFGIGACNFRSLFFILTCP